MKKLQFYVATLALTAGSALAADLPSRKAPIEPPPPPPPPMWTGFYAGLNAGGTWSNNNSVTTAAGPVYASPTFPLGSTNVANALAAVSNSWVSGSDNGGFIGGGQIGYNYQFYNSFLIGLEADIQGIASSSSNRTGSISTIALADFPNESYTAVSTARTNLNYLGTVRGRLGWLATPTFLIYGTGGLAYGGVTLNTASVAQETLVFGGATVYPAAFGGVNYANTQVGWTAGGGVEWMFMPNWSAKVEYLYYNLGTVSQNSVISQFNALQNETWATVGTRTSANFNGNIVRAGVNYHFNWGAAPIVAKY